MIYLKTLPPAGKPICLAVVDFSYFDRNATAFDFINLLKRKLKKSNDPMKAMAMLIYLQARISEHDDVNLGMITMELADPTSSDPFVTLKAMKNPSSSIESRSNISKNTSSPTTFQKTCQRSLAQIIIMFVKLKLINSDCHSGNILGNGNTSYLIDFGRVVKVDRKVSLPPPEDIIDIDITDLYANYTNNDKKENHVIDVLEKIVSYILEVDMFVNNRDKPQMQSVMQYFYDDEDEENRVLSREKLATVIPIIRDLTETPIKSVNAISRRAIENMVRTGRIFSIGDKPLHDFDRSHTAITHEPQSSSSSATSWAASIMNDVFPPATEEAALPSAMVRPTDAVRQTYIDIIKHDYRGFHDDDRVEIKDFREIFQEIVRQGHATESDRNDIMVKVDRILDKLNAATGSTKDKEDILYYTAWFLNEKSAKFREIYVKGFLRDASVTMSGGDVLNLVYMMVGQTLASSRENKFIVGKDLLQLLLRQTTSSQKSRRKRKNPSDNHHHDVGRQSQKRRKTSSRRQSSRDDEEEDSITQSDISASKESVRL